jgi:hypothetical protein
MRSALLQLASSVLLLAFGVQALRVWRRFGTVRRDRAALAWVVTAANFLVVGSYATVHSLVSAAAVASGPESPLYGGVVRWSAATNAGRGIASIAFGLLLLALLVANRRFGPRIAQAAPVVLAATAVAATALGRMVPVSIPSGLVTLMAVLNAVTAVVLMAALLAAVQNDGMDQLLWLSLAVYALKETVSVSLLAVLSFWGVANVSVYHTIFLWLQVVLTGIMVGLAARRLRLASGGRRVPALFERLPEPRRPVHG